MKILGLPGRNPETESWLHALLELLAAWLNAVGVHSLRAIRADVGDFNLAGTLRRGPEETPLAISIHKGRQAVDKGAITALRGGLHKFDHARIGWLITLGQTSEDTAGEAHAEGAAPCAVFDGDALAASMEDVGVGIQRVTLPLAVLDIEVCAGRHGWKTLEQRGGFALQARQQFGVGSRITEVKHGEAHPQRHPRRFVVRACPLGRGERHLPPREEASDVLALLLVLA